MALSSLDFICTLIITIQVLLKHLYTHGINASGTCSSSRRGFPKDMVHEDTEYNRGKFQYASKWTTKLTSWIDQLTINFCSTFNVGQKNLMDLVRLKGVAA